MQLDEGKIDARFVEGDAFLRLAIYAAFDHVRRAHDKAQRDTLSNTFVNGLMTGQSEGPIKEIVLRRLGGMSPHHVRILHALGRVAKQRPLAGLPEGEVGGATYAIDAELRQELSDLSDFEFNTLISDLADMNILGSPYAQGSWGSIEWQGARSQFAFTEFGLAVLKYIHTPASV